MTSTVLALDGSQVGVDGPVEPFLTTSFVVAQLGRHRQEFGSGLFSFGEEEAERLGVAFSEEYNLQAGKLRVGSKSEVDPQTRAQWVLWLGVWFGVTYAVKTVIYNGSSSELLALFDRFVISESSDGVRLSPKPSSGVKLVGEGRGAPDVAMPLRGIGLLHIFQHTRSAARGLPRWEGRRVRGGELFVEDDVQSAEAITLLLVGSSAIARCYPRVAAADPAVIGPMAELTVRWETRSLRSGTAE